MTKKEYSEIIKDIRKYTFSHIYQSLDEVEPHDECVKVIAYEDVIHIFQDYIKGQEARRNMIIQRKKLRKKITIQPHEKKKTKINCYRSRKRKGNHMVIMLVSNDENAGQKIEKEIQKTVKKLENLLDDGISFELYL